MSRVLTVDRTLHLLDMAVHARGAHVVYQPVWVDNPRYLTCLYAVDGAPHCLVGEVLHRAGVSIEVLEMLGDDAIRDLYFADELPLAVTFGAAMVLHRAQLRQDRSVPWGLVLAEARDSARNVDAALRARARHQAAAAGETRLATTWTRNQGQFDAGPRHSQPVAGVEVTETGPGPQRAWRPVDRPKPTGAGPT